MTKASGERWPLFSVVYNRGFANGLTPEAAKIAVSEAWRSGRLRMRTVRCEYRAQPGICLARGEEPPQLKPIITPDFPLHPTITFTKPWDWERSRASRRDAVTKSLFWYYQIEVHPDDVRALWPQEPKAPPQTEAAPESQKIPLSCRVPSGARFGRNRPKDSPMLEGLKKPEDVRRGVWLAVLAIDEVERVEGICSTDIDQDDLLIRAKRRMPERSSGKRVSLGLRTLQTAQAYRRKRDKPS